MLILAGVSINAIVGENGILTNAQNAKLASEEAARREALEMILFNYNSSEFLGEAEGIQKYLDSIKNSGLIESYAMSTDGDYAIINYEGHNYEINRDEEDSNYYKVANEVSDDLKDIGDNFILTQKTLDKSDNFSFEIGKSYIVLDENLSGDDFEFNIPAGEPVTIKIMYDMKIDNKGAPNLSAINLQDGATLNLYIYGNVEVTSSFAEEGEKATGWNAKGGAGAKAGIHVGENSTLNLYGTGILTAKGGNASSGNGTYGTGDSNTGGGGGGGAGAGIGGNGGNGGNANKDTKPGVTGSGCDGEQGENCGSVNIHNNLIVYAYGGSGGASIPGTNAYAGTGGGGYPAAGIGGGGAGGGGGDHGCGGGGYTGGSGQPVLGRGDNGHTANAISTGGTGGAYFDIGLCSYREKYIKMQETMSYIGGQGACAGNTQGGDGGIAGKGGTVKVSNSAKIFAYNGNKYTDDTEYNDGENQLEIFAQNGILRTVYKYDIAWNTAENRSANFFKNLLGSDVHANIDNYVIKENINLHYETSNLLIREEIVENNIRKIKSGYINPNTNSVYGIGSGAGYIELSNGTYQVDNNMN